VNRYAGALSDAILQQLPTRVRELGARIRWVSPLARDSYQEYRDAEFLEQVGLGGFAGEIADFWPSMGPSWDALGIISDSFGRLKPGVILLEAKSHIPEIYGSGCKAVGVSLYKIDRTLAATKQWLGVEEGTDWRAPLYQYANHANRERRRQDETSGSPQNSPKDSRYQQRQRRDSRVCPVKPRLDEVAMISSRQANSRNTSGGGSQLSKAANDSAIGSAPATIVPILRHDAQEAGDATP
jgi:hypothetical protein